MSFEQPPMPNREQQIREKAHEIHQKREAGKEPGFTWQEIDKMLQEKGLTPGTEEARKFMEKYDWSQAEKEQKKKEFVEKMAKAKNEKRLRGWREHFGPLAELREESEKTPEPPEKEKLMKTELDPEWVLGKERAKLAKELGERIRNKSEETKREEKTESLGTEFETKEGKKFFTERLTNPEDPRVEKVQAMLENHFGKEELDSIEMMKQAMTGEMETGEKVPPYLIHVAENSKGEIEGVYTGAVCETVDKKGKVSEKSAVSLGFYTVVATEMRKKGIFKNLLKAFEKSSAKDAKDRGLNIKGLMGEAHDEIEEPMNKQGVRRAYIKADGVFFEVPYEQPPVDWNQETGKPAEGAGVMPEHLMLKLTSGKDKVSGKELMEMVRGMYNYNNYREEEYFKSGKAYNDHTKSVKKIEQNLADFIAGKTIYLLSAKEREAMKKKGVQFSEQEVGK